MLFKITNLVQLESIVKIYHIKAMVNKKKIIITIKKTLFVAIYIAWTTRKLCNSCSTLCSAIG